MEGSGSSRAATAATVFASTSHPEDRTLPEYPELGETLTCLPARSLSLRLSILRAEDRCESRRNQPGRVQRPGGRKSRRRTGAGAAYARAPGASPTSSVHPASGKLPKLGASQSWLPRESQLVSGERRGCWGSSRPSPATRAFLQRTRAGLPRVPAGVAPSARVRSPMTALAVARVARPLGVSEGAGEEEEAV